MKWGEHNLYWGRPLKSILAIFDNKPLKFKFHHLSSANSTYIDKDFEEKTKIFKNINSYFSYFKKLNIIIDNDLRKKYIKKKLTDLSNKKNLQVNINEKLLNEVTNIVEKPKVISCTFDKKYLNIPKETLVIDITTHNKNGSIEMKDIFNKNEIKYVESPVMGGPVQAEEGVLGGIVGASEEDYNLAKIYLDSFCKET